MKVLVAGEVESGGEGLVASDVEHHMKVSRSEDVAVERTQEFANRAVVAEKEVRQSCLASCIPEEDEG